MSVHHDTTKQIATHLRPIFLYVCLTRNIEKGKKTLNGVGNVKCPLSKFLYPINVKLKSSILRVA